MKNTIKILFLFVLFSYSQNAYPAKPLNKPSDWYAYEQEKGKCENPQKLFDFQKNRMRFSGSKIGYIISKKTYQDFRLTLQYRWNLDTVYFKQKSNIKNSGVMYLVPDTAKDILWPAGIQFQVKEGFTGDFIFLNGVTVEIDSKRTTAGKSMVYSRKADAEKLIGKWNEIEINFQSDIITQKLNGKIVNIAKNPSVKSGRILLQYEGYPIDFRKIKISDL